MSLRIRLLLIFGSIVVVTVALVSYSVSNRTRKAFQALDKDQTEAIIGQFDREFELQGQALAERAQAMASNEQVLGMARALSVPGGDPAPFLNLAKSLASELDYLEFLAPDGTIISSAHWPARFGLREPWATQDPALNTEPAFLKYEDSPRGSELALLAVRELSVADRKFFIVAGRRIDSNFLRSLVLPEGTRLFLWQQPPGGGSGELQDVSGPINNVPADLKTLLEETRRTSEDIARRVRLDDTPNGIFSARTIRRLGRGSTQPLAILIVASSRRRLSELQGSIRWTGFAVALTGILLSIAASGWWAARISHPIEELSSAAQDVAAGNWERKVETGSAGDKDKDEVTTLIASFNKMTDELLRQRDRAVQAERVAAWRELARRLAHELKNPLFPLQITVENLMKARQQNSPEFNEIFAESTTTLLAELSNLRKIVGRFSDFSRMPAPQWQMLDLNGMVEDIARLFAPQLASAQKPINLEKRLAAGDARISGDPDLLRRAFENLVLNAIDAMPGGGTLRIATSATQDRVIVEISDGGTGLTEEEADRLFTPYYTTKQHGTGLGLAIVQSVISDHGARISVASRPGEGTTFRMEFQRRPAMRHVSGDAFAGKV